MPFGYERKLQYPEKNHTSTGNTCKLHAGGVLGKIQTWDPRTERQMCNPHRFLGYRLPMLGLEHLRNRAYEFCVYLSRDAYIYPGMPVLAELFKQLNGKAN